ncbi:MAG TPA: YicC/YloC family endoribonuclease, partial [Terriglobales bacterium]|nr:YicC/YloC family endoribonuclease [Terriglobales bacterium]
MTGFAQVKGQVVDPRNEAPGKNRTGFTLSLKSVNHRFLDVHFRMPSDSDSLEMKLRRLLKDKLARGHVELTLNLDRGSGDSFALNRQIVGGYIQAFRTAAAEFSL